MYVFLNLIYKLKLTQSEEFNFVCCNVIGLIITMLLYYIAVRSMCSCYCVHLLFPLGSLVSLINLLNSWASFRPYIWRANMNVSLKWDNWSLIKLLVFFLDCLFDTDFFFFLIIFYGPALRCGIQFLGNLAVGNQMCKDDIWQQSFPNLLL